MLGSDIPKVGLDIALPTQAFTGIARRMRGRGFNLNFTGTHREFINHLTAQKNKYMVTHHDKGAL